MKRLAAILIACALAGTVMAQEVPGLYDVTGVAADDVLNLRAGPDAAADKLGDLAPDATGIEVTALRDGWGRVNLDGGTGWVSMAYMAAQPEGDYTYAQRIGCFGTEPFWRLDITQGQSATFDAMDGPGQSFSIGLLIRAANRTDRHFLLGQGNGQGQAETGGMTAILHRAECSDGMSDRLYGLDLDLLLGTDDGPVLYSGCCSLSP